MQDLIAVGVKTHFIYHVVAKNNAYKQPLPDVFEDRPGQMDAFGIASGLVAIHTRRPDNSFLEFVRRDNPDSPFFSGFSKANGLPVDMPGMTERGDRREGRRRPDLQEHSRHGRRRSRRPSTSRASTGRPSATTPTGTAIRAPRRARWRPARRRPAIRAWSTCGSTSRSTRSSTTCRRRRIRSRASIWRGRARARRSSRRSAPAATRPGNQTIYPVVEAWRGPEPHDGEHERVALRAGGAGDGGLRASTA